MRTWERIIGMTLVGIFFLLAGAAMVETAFSAERFFAAAFMGVVGVGLVIAMWQA